MSTIAVAAPQPEVFDQAAFEKRFHAADKDRNGKLSRKEAYAEFPRMPAYFDEIDADKDGRIGLPEIKRAMTRRVDAAIRASQAGSQYVGAVNVMDGGAISGSGEVAAPRSFSNKAEARRHYRYEYYESLAGSQEQASNRGEPVVPAVPAQLEKSF